MKKLILSTVAFLGLFGAVVAPAQAQVLVNSTPSGGSITGAASFTNFNGSTSAIAGEATFPLNTYSATVRVTPITVGGSVTGGNVVLQRLGVAPLDPGDITNVPPTSNTSVEAAVASQITAAPNLNARVSYIRAWTSGGLN